MSGRHHNQLPHNLPQLQNLIKRDPPSYKDEFMQQYQHFQANLKLFEMDPSQDSKTIQDLVMFLSQVTQCYPEEMDKFPQQLQELLRKYCHVMDPDVLMSFCRSLMLMRSKGKVDPVSVLELFFYLFRVQNKLLRKTLYSFIVNDLKRLNQKHRNNSVNKTLQNYMFAMVRDSNPIAAKMSLDVMVELYKKNVWSDAKTVNIVVTACFSSTTKVMVAAIKFFLGKDEDADNQEDSSDSEDEPNPEVVKRLLLAKRVSKKTRKKEKKTEKALAHMKKQKKKKKGHQPVFSGLHLVNDPQEFAEKLFKRLEKSKEKFEVKLLLMNLISKLIGVHQLLLFNFYPFLQRYIQPHQKDVTKVLVYLAQACHSLVPPEVLLPTVRAITDNFITERNASEVMAVGLNAVREVCARCPLVMYDDLLQDLTSYKTHKERSVVMAARSLIQLFRNVNPDLLHKKDKGKPTEAMPDRPLEYGEVRPAVFIPGTELLNMNRSEQSGKPERSSGDGESDCDIDGESEDDGGDGEDGGGDVEDGGGDGEDNGGDDEDDGSDGEDDGGDGEDDGSDGEDDGGDGEDDGGDGEDDSSIDKDGDNKKLTQNKSPKEIIDEDIQRRKNAAMQISQTRLLTPEDFEKIQVKQVAQKLETRKSRKRKAKEIEELENSDAERKEFVSLADIAFVHKKKRSTREEKIAQAEAGRKGREKYAYQKRRQNPFASTTNKEKSKKKAFTMVIHKKGLRKKKARSFKEKQIALRNSLLKRRKMKK